MSSRGHILKADLGGVIGSYDLQLVETEVLSAAETTHDMDTTLDGDTMGGVLLAAYIESDATVAANYTIRLNGADMAGSRARQVQSNTTVTGVIDTTVTVLGLQANSGTTYKGTFWFYMPFPKSGEDRVAYAWASHNGNTTYTLENSMYVYSITTPSTATNITSIGLSSSQTDGLGINSRFKLFKVTN